MSALPNSERVLVSAKSGLTRTRALLVPSRTPPVRRPERPPPDGSGASEASGRSARGGADLAYSNLGLTEMPLLRGGF